MSRFTASGMPRGRPEPIAGGAEGAMGASGPELRLLGPIDLVGGRRLTSQQLSLVALLGCAGSCRRVDIVEALWDGRPISEARLANLLSEVRAALGRGHLPDADGGRYRLLGVSTDLERFRRLVRRSPRPDPAAVQCHLPGLAPAPTAPPTTAPASTPGGPSGPGPGCIDDLGPGHEPGRHAGHQPGHPADHDDRLGSGPPEAALVEALSLVRGPVLTAPDGAAWGWLDHLPELAASTEALVAATASRLAGRYRARGDLEGARWACERGLTASPLDRSLVELLERVYHDQGRPGAAHRLVGTWRSRLRRLDGPDADRQASSGSAVTTTLPR